MRSGVGNLGVGKDVRTPSTLSTAKGGPARSPPALSGETSLSGEREKQGFRRFLSYS
jgi:hypothetical protein